MKKLSAYGYVSGEVLELKPEELLAELAWHLKERAGFEVIIETESLISLRGDTIDIVFEIR